MSTQVFLTSPTGSLQTYTSPSDWNNSNNTIECVGGGGSGTAASSTTHGPGAGAGAYSAITNFTFAVPGTTTASYQLATGGAINIPSSSGNNGGSTWFNNATDPGVGTDNSKCSAFGADGGPTPGTGLRNGGLGGPTSLSWGQTKFAGGRGGNLTGASGTGASGGGGAGGPSGAGGNGVDSSSTGANIVTAGGTANNGTVAGGTTAGAIGNAGNSGTEWTTKGVGSGGAGGAGGAGVLVLGGAGGLYGGGGGGSQGGNASSQANAGGQGIIVITYTVSNTAIAGSAYNTLPDNLPRKPRYDEQVNSTFFFPVAIGREPLRNWYTADDLPRKPLYREQPIDFFFVQVQRFQGIPSFQPPDPKQVKPLYVEQPQPFFLRPIQRPTHGWDFQPDILPRPLKVVDYRPMFFRIRTPTTFGTINI